LHNLYKTTPALHKKIFNTINLKEYPGLNAIWTVFSKKNYDFSLKSIVSLLILKSLQQRILL